ncbi:B12-binding domain-containing radical SAM protein [Deltaproteobacteria bacterium OttesenSCG-928-M10]|nr:B12-binding domain-containing radical SAM protein [Deltaproteobacteria bacterium OttesenSCG-928-M10]
MSGSPPQADILLVNPPSGIFYGLGPNFAPMGLFSLAAVLREQGFSVSILNANYFPDYHAAAPPGGDFGLRRPDGYYYAEDDNNPIWPAVLDFIHRTDPKLLGFSVHDLAVGGVKKLAKAIKDRNPDRLLAVGGATATCAPDIFADTPAVDFLLAGEGEETLAELAEALRDNHWRRPAGGPRNRRGEIIAGLRLLGESGLEFTGPRPPLADLDALPRPDLTYFWLDYARHRVVKDRQLNGLATSRGCLKSCRFCGARAIWPGPVRYRSIEKVVAEAAALRAEHGYDFQHFSIFDDDFLARPERVFEFCRRLAALNDDYRFRCYGRVNNLQDEKLLETLFQAGCREIWVGVESGSQKVLKNMGKGITVEQIKRLDRLFQAYDFPWLAFIILGTPGEEEGDIRETLAMLKEGHFPAIQPFTFQPYTGTAFFNEMRAAGLIGHEDIIRGHQNLPQCFSQNVSRERFFQLFEELRQLAEERRRANDFYLTDEETALARLVEDQAAGELRTGRARPRLVIGPERQLRWLAALNHYRNIGADLTFLDLKAEQDRPTRFGLIQAGTHPPGREAEEILVVSPPAEADAWPAEAERLYPGLPLRIFKPDGFEGRPVTGGKIWRPVFEICRPPLKRGRR